MDRFWKETIGHVLEKYQIWSSYGVESEGVFIAYASLHGNTEDAAKKCKEILEKKDARRWQSRIWRAVIWRRRWKMHSGMENCIGSTVL